MTAPRRPPAGARSAGRAVSRRTPGERASALGGAGPWRRRRRRLERCLGPVNHPGSQRAPRRAAAAPEDGRGGGGLPGAAQVLHRVVVDLSVDRVVLHRALPGLHPAGAAEDQRQPEHRSGPGPAAPPPPRKVSASRSLGVAAGGGARARGRAASGGGPSPAALAGPRCLGAGGARPPHARECPGGPWLVPAEPRELPSFTRGSSVRTAATGVLLPAERRRPTRGPGCGRTLLGSRVEPWPAGCRCEVDREGMSVGPSRSRDDVSGHPTECPGDTRTRGDLGFLTSPVAVFMFSAELALKCDGLNKCACGA